MLCDCDVHHARGFSLVELAVVVALVGVLSTLAGPNLLRLRTQMRTKAAATEIAALLRRGRGAAMSENATFALVVRMNDLAKSQDDVVALVRCQSTTTNAYDFSSLSDGMLKGTTALPAGFTLVRRAELAADVGFGPGSAGILSLSPFYASVPRASACSFCGSDNGAVVFDSDGVISFSSGSAALPEMPWASLTLTVGEHFAAPAASYMYTVSLAAETGDVRVWH